MKAILTIDMPDHCKNCPLHDISSMEGDWLCLAAGGKWIETQQTVPEQKPKWCPLKPLPSSATESDYAMKKCFDKALAEDWMSFEEGWNACLDEIVGETE